jgi:dTDP-4-amino-4,6-dideoxygalactose transaminase
MDTIMDIANRHNLFVIEDAAQGMMSSYKGKALGTIGHFGTFSFHETKNYTSGGEGGLLIINDEDYITKAEIIREKGTNRSQFFRGMVDKYSWVDIGSSYLMNDLSAAYLWGQLDIADEINDERVNHWKMYYKGLSGLSKKGVLELPTVPDNCIHNAHMFFIKVKDLNERTNLIEHLKSHGIHAVFHYVPLHTAPAGIKFGRFSGEDTYTTKDSERLVRLPLYYGIKQEDIESVINTIVEYYA